MRLLRKFGAQKITLNFQKTGENCLLPSVAQVRPPHLLQALKQRLIQQNVTLLENTQLEPLKRVHQIDGWKAKPIFNSRDAPSGADAEKVLQADAFVVTSGAWSFELLKDTAAGLNIKPMRGQILLFDTSQLNASQIPKHSLKHIVYRDGFYLVPRRDGLLLAGSTLEDVGFDTNTTETMRQQLQQKAEQILPSLKYAPAIKHWCGLRPGTPDNLPTIAQHPSIENLFLNTGHFRYGLTMAPASAELVAKLVCG